VEALRDELGLPGMRVLHFGLGEPDNPHHPANHPVHVVAYTGTHDNDTSLGWATGAGPAEKAALAAMTDAGGAELGWAMIDAVFRSRAQVAIVPLQDVLGLGSEARMNTPGTAAGNWAWRFAEGALTPELGARLRAHTRAAGRDPSAPAEPSSSPTPSETP
jgi:4-alpha-glucanotransferase